MNLFPQKVYYSTIFRFLSRIDKENTKKMRRMHISFRCKEKNKCMYFKYCYVYFLRLQKIKCHFSVRDDMHKCALNSSKGRIWHLLLAVFFISLYILSLCTYCQISMTLKMENEKRFKKP